LYVTIVTTVTITSGLCLFYHENQIIMKKNMGNADRMVRIIIAAIVAILFFTNVISGTVGVVLLVLAGIFVLTSLISFCPLYAPFGISTCKRKA
jgi:hypothetical protein